jgi:transcriptional regulator with XRE-family HTH domain
MAKKDFRSRVLEMRPDAAETRAADEMKRKLALALRALRKRQGLTQKDVETRSALSQPMISRLEAPTGPLPNWDTIRRYVEACGGHMLVGFGAQAFDERAFVTSGRRTTEEVVAAIAV